MTTNAFPVLNPVPDIAVTLSYGEIYDDYSDVSPDCFIDGIPTSLLLDYVVKLQNLVLYAITDYETQRKIIIDLRNHIEDEYRHKVDDFLKRQQLPIFMSNETSILFFQFALSKYVPLRCNGDTLSQEEIKNIYKALLYCNKIWSDYPLQGFDNTKHQNMVDMSLLLDMPIVEFKSYKDFLTQMYKASRFFMFCEKDPIYSKHLHFFYNDNKISDWRDYLSRIFCMINSTLNCQYVTFDEASKQHKCFFDKYAIDVTDKQLIASRGKINEIKYFRNHFLFPVSKSSFLLLNANLLTDKLYQGMRFDFYDSIKLHKSLNAKEHEYGDIISFFDELGMVFSEKYIFYPIIHKCFDSVASCVLEGEQMRAAGIVGEPDCYVRINDKIFIFEHKDSLMGDQYKFSNNIDTIKQTIRERICIDGTESDGEEKRKGGGQLLMVIDEMLNNKMIERLDCQSTNPRKIYPIIVTTDTAFSANGVSGVVADDFNKIMKGKHNSIEKFPIAKPTIINIDTLIKLSWGISSLRWDFETILKEYIDFNINGLVPFSSFCMDNYLRNYYICPEENQFLLGDIFKE